MNTLSTAGQRYLVLPPFECDYRQSSLRRRDVLNQLVNVSPLYRQHAIVVLTQAEPQYYDFVHGLQTRRQSSSEQPCRTQDDSTPSSKDSEKLSNCFVVGNKVRDLDTGRIEGMERLQHFDWLRRRLRCSLEEVHDGRSGLVFWVFGYCISYP